MAKRLQGIAWIDAAAKRIVRLRLDAFGPIEGIPLETITTDIGLAPVNFKRISGVLWLPARVTVARALCRRRAPQRASVFGLPGGDQEERGHSGSGGRRREDAYELLTRGITLIQDGKSGDAIAPLREALRLDPAMPAARFHLANALRTTGDWPARKPSCAKP